MSKNNHFSENELAEQKATEEKYATKIERVKKQLEEAIFDLQEDKMNLKIVQEAARANPHSDSIAAKLHAHEKVCNSKQAHIDDLTNAYNAALEYYNTHLATGVPKPSDFH